MLKLIRDNCLTKSNVYWIVLASKREKIDMLGKFFLPTNVLHLVVYSEMVLKESSSPINLT